ncbi:hypothetical protein [Sphaerisporangium perillae]|uniref:hypothetical protein n=1 Tax=Sphaerisporangium perillae TaxID=2935860 RepID=UPI00200C972E|nr:hypothetical protein [Sphaerisporangium perillae]
MLACLVVAGGVGVGVVTVISNRAATVTTPTPVAKPTGPDTAAKLREAVSNLSGLPAIRYKGTLGGASTSVGLDVTVMKGGAAYGRLTVKGSKVDVLSVDDFSSKKTFLKGNLGYWTARGVPAAIAKNYLGKWVKIPAGKTTATAFDTLVPSKLAQMVNPPGTTPHAAPEPGKQVNGVPTQVLLLPIGRVHMTTTPPYRIVRIELPKTGGDGGGLGGGKDPGIPGITDVAGQGRPAFQPALSRPSTGRLAGGHLDLTALSPQDAQVSAGSLKAKIGQLRSSIDSQVSIQVKGTGSLSPCDSSACTAHARLGNRLLGKDPDHRLKPKVAIDVTIAFRLDGSPIGSCKRTIVMRMNSVGAVSCGITYHANPGQSHSMAARITALPRSMTKASIDDMLEVLKRKN